MSGRQDSTTSSDASDADSGSSRHGPSFRASRNRRRAALALVGVIALGLAVSADDRAGRNPGVDFYQLWLVTRWVEQGGDHHIYGEGNQHRLAEFASRASLQPRSSSRERTAASQNLDLYEGRIEPYGSPLLYASVGAISSGDYDRDLELFEWATILAYTLAIALLGWSFRYSAIAIVLAIGILTHGFLPLDSLLHVGNVAGLQLLPIAMFVALQARQSDRAGDLVGGLLIGIAIAFKPTAAFVLLPPAVVWAIDFDVRRAVTVAIGMLAAWLLGFVWGAAYFGSGAVWSAWLVDLSSYLAAGPTAVSGNCSIPGVVAHAHGIRIGVPVLVGFLALVGLAAWRTRPLQPEATPVGEIRSGTAVPRTALAAALGGVLGIFVSPLAWYHYLVIAVPLILWTWRPLETDGRGTLTYRAAALVALLLLSILPLEAGLPRRFVELWLGNAALILLAGLGLRDLASAPAPRTMRSDKRRE